MQLTKHIGCLLALVFATASAFAADWFTADLAGVGTSPWSAAPAGWEQVTTDVYKFNDWTKELVYTAATAANTISSNSVIKTEVQFTAMDKADFFVNDAPQAAPAGAKAGLTIVEDSDATPPTTNFYGIVESGGVKTWVALDGDTTAALEDQVEVKVEIFADGTNSRVRYTVGGHVLTYGGAQDLLATAGTTDFEIQSVSYKGCVPALSSLDAFAYGNTAAAKEEVEITETIEGVPSKIDYNPADLADRGVDVTSAAAVREYLTGTKENGLKGWVNATLGLDDTQTVAVASSACTTKGSVNVDFGFIEDGNSTIQYVVDGGTAQESATINTGTSGIKEVTVKVTQNGTTVELDPVKVGVMNTGKQPTEAQKAATTPTNVFDIVAVPFEAFQGKVTVSNVLNTAELNAGDKLYIHNGEGYDTFVLEAGAWKAEGATSYSREKSAKDMKSADEYDLTAGQAIWIERNPNSMIVFAGKGEINVSHTWTWKPEYGDYSLVANPTVNDFVLNDKTFGGVGDTIIVEDVANPQQFERTAGGWGEWKVVEYMNKRGKGTKLEWTAGGTIKAGIGFWYYKADAGAEKPATLTIDFGTNAAPTTPEPDPAG